MLGKSRWRGQLSTEGLLCVTTSGQAESRSRDPGPARPASRLHAPPLSCRGSSCGEGGDGHTAGSAPSSQGPSPPHIQPGWFSAPWERRPAGRHPDGAGGPGTGTPPRPPWGSRARFLRPRGCGPVFSGRRPFGRLPWSPLDLPADPGAASAPLTSRSSPNRAGALSGSCTARDPLLSVRGPPPPPGPRPGLPPPSSGRDLTCEGPVRRNLEGHSRPGRPARSALSFSSGSREPWLLVQFLLGLRTRGGPRPPPPPHPAGLPSTSPGSLNPTPAARPCHRVPLYLHRERKRQPLSGAMMGAQRGAESPPSPARPVWGREG